MMHYGVSVMDAEIKSLKRKKRSVRDSKVKWCNIISRNTTKLSERIKA